MDPLSPFALIIGAIFVNNVVLAQFLGICPFLGVSKDVKSSLGMGGAVLFVMLLATVVTWLIYTYLLYPIDAATNEPIRDLRFLQTIVYILVIAGLVQMVEIVLKKTSPSLYQTLGVFLPLITTNCAVLGVAILVIQKEMNLLQSTIYSASIALGFTLALVIFAGIREQMELTGVPKGMKGVPIALVTAGILAMAFMGFGGIVPIP
ncbi:MAG: electron transport complex protein RnfA [Bacteroidales bacterium]|nr:electron transport complex protein RnfA [Bacteroidales bacterium]